MPGRKAALAAPLLFLLYFYGLARAGLLGPDEPRYASIGREMAVSGDWVTPRLWGAPWFEKPALLYWMTGAARLAGLGDELAPRLPVALLSVAFLAFYWWILRREFGASIASYSAVMLATSAGWLAFSHAGVTDLPLSACYGAAMVFALRWLREGGAGKAAAIGALLGAAVLAKGLVPLVLAVPLVWFARRRWRELLVLGCAALAVAAPWYFLCWQRNGSAFIDEFFWKHHFGRFTTDALRHRQPAWFYLPVLAGLVLPWTPVLALLGRLSRGGEGAVQLWRDERHRFLLATAAFGLVFFSAAENKLPGYLLPLLPLIFVPAGAALDKAPKARWTLAVCALCTAVFPLAGTTLPAAISSGLSRAPIDRSAWLGVLPAIVLAAACLRVRRAAGTVLIASAVVCWVVWITIAVFPEIDRLASPRPVWEQLRGNESRACAGPVTRSMRYGLNYYTVQPLPDCASHPAALEIRQDARGALFIDRR